MADFFHEWRRKIGVATLVMACVLMAGWVRSVIVSDQIQIPSEESYSSIASKAGTVSFLKSTGPDLVTPGNRVTRWRWLSTKIEPPEKFESWLQRTQYQSEWSWNWCGFVFDNSRWSFKRQTGMLFTRTIPYWSLVIPLTLLSAYLLLSKPRKSIQNKTAEPVPEKVA